MEYTRICRKLLIAYCCTFFRVETYVPVYFCPCRNLWTSIYLFFVSELTYVNFTCYASRGNLPSPTWALGTCPLPLLCLIICQPQSCRVRVSFLIEYVKIFLEFLFFLAVIVLRYTCMIICHAMKIIWVYTPIVLKLFVYYALKYIFQF